MQAKSKHWGFWQVLFLSVAILLLNIILQFLVMLAFALPEMIRQNDLTFTSGAMQYYMQKVSSHNGVMAWSLIIPSLLPVLVIFFLVRLKEANPKSNPESDSDSKSEGKLDRPWRCITDHLKKYLKLQPVSAKHFLFWQVIMVATYFAIQYLTDTLAMPEPRFMKFMRDLLASGSGANSVLIFIAVSVAAPLFEEFFFRGFLFSGIASSRLGRVGAAIITSLAWSLIHMQYEIVWIGIIFCIGLLFSLARIKSDSIYTVIAMHSLNNLLTFIDLIGIT